AGVPRAPRPTLRQGRAPRPAPRAQAAPARTRDSPRALGRRPRAPQDHQAVLRPLRPRDQRARLRAAPRPPRPGAGLRRDVLGDLSIVLHTHMPYVEGYGTWPFGEEWLWEAIVTSYLPVLEVLDDHEVTVTVSLTPVLADQLEAPGVDERLYA